MRERRAWSWSRNLNSYGLLIHKASTSRVSSPPSPRMTRATSLRCSSLTTPQKEKPSLLKHCSWTGKTMWHTNTQCRTSSHPTRASSNSQTTGWSTTWSPETTTSLSSCTCWHPTRSSLTRNKSRKCRQSQSFSTAIRISTRVWQRFLKWSATWTGYASFRFPKVSYLMRTSSAYFATWSNVSRRSKTIKLRLNMFKAI